MKVENVSNNNNDDNNSDEENVNDENVFSEVGIEDAFEYFAMIRARFYCEPFTYRYFVGIINEYKYGRIAIGGLVQRIRVLFEGHPDLIEEFNKFLPPDHRVSPIQAQPES